MTKAILLTSIFFASTSFAAITNFKPSDGKVEFLAIGNPSAIKIAGTGEGPSGKVEISGKSATGELSFQLNTLDTKIETRNKHMKEKYLQTEKFPTAMLKISKFESTQDLSKGNYSVDVPFEGKLTLHGVERPVSGVAKLDKKDSAINLAAKFKINIKDYNVDIPSFAGIKVAEDVDVDVHATSQVQ